nr:hypothetical protein [uncultured Rhodopila sp.]
MFQTEIEECLYATDGGTLFLVSYRDRVYAVTCGHVVKNFELGQLIITGKRYPLKGDKPAPIQGRYFPSSPEGAATDSDILDICIIDFKSEVKPSFFSDPAYIIDDATICTSHNGHNLLISGCLKDQSAILEPDIAAGFAILEYQDGGAASFDPLLRSAVAEFAWPAFGRVTGLSGAPVYDVTANALCGVVMRGTMTGRKSTIHFLDAFHIVEMLKMIDRNDASTSYTRGVWQEIKLPLPLDLPQKR